MKPTFAQRMKYPYLWRRWGSLHRIVHSLLNEIKEMQKLGLNCDEAQEMINTMTQWKDNITLEMQK